MNVCIKIRQMTLSEADQRCPSKSSKEIGFQRIKGEKGSVFEGFPGSVNKSFRLIRRILSK